MVSAVLLARASADIRHRDGPWRPAGLMWCSEWPRALLQPGLVAGWLRGAAAAVPRPGSLVAGAALGPGPVSLRRANAGRLLKRELRGCAVCKGLLSNVDPSGPGLA